MTTIIKATILIALALAHLLAFTVAQTSDISAAQEFVYIDPKDVISFDPEDLIQIAVQDRTVPIINDTRNISPEFTDAELDNDSFPIEFFGIDQAFQGDSIDCICNRWRCVNGTAECACDAWDCKPEELPEDQ